MSKTKGRRYYGEEPKLNIKKVIATIIAIIVLVMFVISLKNLLSETDVPNTVSTVTAYFSAYADNKWGVIDNNGNIVIDNVYDEMIIIPDKTKDLFICTYDVNYDDGTYKTRILNKNNEEILTDYNNVQAIENYQNNNLWYENDILKFEKDGKYGLINFSGKEIIPAEYDKIYPLQGIQKSILIEKDGKVGLVSNSLGEIIIEPIYTEIKSLTDTYENGYIVKNENSKYGVISTDKKVALEVKYDDILNVASTDMYAVREDGILKLINKLGETILSEGFTDIIHIDSDSVVIKNNDKFGVIDITGNSIIPCEYDDLKLAFEKTYIAKKDDKYGLINSGNEVIKDFVYTSMNYIKNANFIEADKENFKTDIIDSLYQIALTDIIISDINIDKGYMRIRENSDYKYYNFKFEEKSSKDVMPTNTLFLVKENGKYGFENKDGKRIVDCIYDDATEQNEYGYSAIKKDGLWGSIKQNGTVVLEPSVNLDNNLYINFIEKWHIYDNYDMNVYTK